MRWALGEAGESCPHRFLIDADSVRNRLEANVYADVVAPDLCWATQGNVSRWGDRCRYFFHGVQGRSYTAGRPDIILGPEWTVTFRGVNYRFERDDLLGCCSHVEAYVLVAHSFSGSVWQRLKNRLLDSSCACNSLRLSWAGATVRDGRVVSIGNRREIEAVWACEHQSETDPLAASLLARARSQAMADASNLEDPRVLASQLRRLRSAYSVQTSVGGAYGWGYCYGCGRTAKGKFRARVCRECDNAKNQGPLARLVGSSADVCTLRAPVLYPGLVHVPKSHPPLKSGVSTNAVDGVSIKVISTRARRRGRPVRIPLERVLSQTPDETVFSRGPTLAGVGLSAALPFVTRPGARPLAEAICYRVFKTLPQDRVINHAAFRRATSLAQSDLLLGPWLNSQPVPMPVDEWVESMGQARRRKALAKARKEREERGAPHPEFEFVTPFVKQELLPGFGRKHGMIQGGQTSYVARLIQAPNDETHLVAGPLLKPLVRALKTCWNADHWLFYGSVGPEKLNRWLNRIKGCQSFFWSDYSAFDATFSLQTWKMLEGFYRQLYPLAPMEFWEVMDVWRRPRGRALVRGEGVRIEYEAGVCNCSGRDDTSLANALFNGLALSLAFAAALAQKSVSAVTESDLQRASELCIISIVGDDSLVGCNFDVAQYAGAIERNLKQFGLVVKAEHSQRLCDVTYLGMMPYPVGGTYYWGPTLGRRMYKLFWMREPGAPAAWARGVAQAMSQYRHVPVLWELSTRVDELLHGTSVTRLVADRNRPWTMVPSDCPGWDISTLNFLVERYAGYGLTKQMILDDIRVIGTIDRLPAVVHLASLECILQADDL